MDDDPEPPEPPPAAAPPAPPPPNARPPPQLEAMPWLYDAGPAIAGPDPAPEPHPPPPRPPPPVPAAPAGLAQPSAPPAPSAPPPPNIDVPDPAPPLAPTDLTFDPDPTLSPRDPQPHGLTYLPLQKAALLLLAWGAVVFLALTCLTVPLATANALVQGLAATQSSLASFELPLFLCPRAYLSSALRSATEDDPGGQSAPPRAPLGRPGEKQSDGQIVGDAFSGDQFSRDDGSGGTCPSSQFFDGQLCATQPSKTAGQSPTDQPAEPADQPPTDQPSEGAVQSPAGPAPIEPTDQQTRAPVLTMNATSASDSKPTVDVALYCATFFAFAALPCAPDVARAALRVLYAVLYLLAICAYCVHVMLLRPLGVGAWRLMDRGREVVRHPRAKWWAVQQHMFRAAYDTMYLEGLQVHGSG